MKFRRPFFACCYFLLLLAGVTLLGGCSRGQTGSKEMAYVSAPQAFLRDQVAAVYNKAGTVKNGERCKYWDATAVLPGSAPPAAPKDGWSSATW